MGGVVRYKPTPSETWKGVSLVARLVARTDKSQTAGSVEGIIEDIRALLEVEGYNIEGLTRDDIRGAMRLLDRARRRLDSMLEAGEAY